MIHKKYLSCSRKRISFFIIPLILVSLIFILYQISIFLELSGQLKVTIKSVLIRGTHELQARFYKQKQDNTFICIHSMEIIHYNRINDDYCDCMDGSDEPGTNACSNAIFYCANQKIPKSIHSSKVNDGICDCCDGSDEWKNNSLDKLRETLPKSAYRNHPPCPNVC